MLVDLNSILAQRPKVDLFRRKHRIGLLTLLFTDIVGSTKLKQDLDDHKAIELIQSHHDPVLLPARFRRGDSGANRSRARVGGALLHGADQVPVEPLRGRVRIETCAGVGGPGMQ